MGLKIEIMPTTKLTPNSGTDYIQPTSNVVPVGDHCQGALILSAEDCNIEDTTSIVVKLQTAIDNMEGQYVDLVELVTYDSESDVPDKIYVYLRGSTSGSSSAPGFANYLRVYVELGHASNYLTMSLKGFLKP